MKVFDAPFPAPSYSSGIDYATWMEDERLYLEKVRDELRSLGYTGANTGKLFHIPMADGAAIYMVAANAKGMILVHCPIGDAWQAQEWQTRGLRKSDVIKRMYDIR